MILDYGKSYNNGGIMKLSEFTNTFTTARSGESSGSDF